MRKLTKKACIATDLYNFFSFNKTQLPGSNWTFILPVLNTIRTLWQELAA
ncbi:hypothetical protein Niako_0667 [Niastella koreensis GR20-10]|uniref:Uncharacterized protein n=1 Tax=Niastella koreensis (strain DSM 17620 / KACC 11465 / NBRC 106392 / GR20-10) TaxID=700598 RepID=G8TAA4_NIAKG|nr:hypothetical protein [Niastella koreensis]AEV97051.1 hypothetical protein Niako_0667 [Niastella koreensis GR20-10]